MRGPLNATTVAAWVAAALVVALAGDNPVYRGLVLVAALALLIRGRRPETRLKPLLTSVGVGAALSLVLNAALSHQGTDLLLELPGWLPGVGGSVTAEGLLFGTGVGIGLSASVLAAAALSVTLEAHELVDAMPAWLGGVAAAGGSALNLVPSLSRSFTAVKEAQRLRGWRPRGPRSWSQVVVPAVLTAVESSVQLAESMEARGFGSGPRTHLTTAAVGRADLAVRIASALAAMLFIGGQRLGYATDWYPYPSLYAPPLDAIGLAACLLLFVPVALWRR